MELVSQKDERHGVLDRPLAGWLNGAIVLVTLIGIVRLERQRPLRRRVEAQPYHEARNLAMSILSAAAIRLTEKPLMDWLTRLVDRRPRRRPARIMESQAAQRLQGDLRAVADGKPSGMPIDVLTDFIKEDSDAMGRPVGVAVDIRGALLVADDVGNTVWRVTAARRTP